MTSRKKTPAISVPEFLQEDIVPSCSTVDPELFFPQEIEIGNKIISKYSNLSMAKEICSSCPLKIDCLEYALRNSEIGIWGGTTESQRDTLRRSSRISVNRRPASPQRW